MRNLAYVLTAIALVGLYINIQSNKDTPPKLSPAPPPSAQVEPVAPVALASPSVVTTAAPTIATSSPIPTLSSWTWKRGAAIQQPVQPDRAELEKLYRDLLRMKRRAVVLREFQAFVKIHSENLLKLQKQRGQFLAQEMDPAKLHFESVQSAMAPVFKQLQNCN